MLHVYSMPAEKVHRYVNRLVTVSDAPLYTLSHLDMDQPDTVLVTVLVDQEYLMDKAGQETLMELMEGENLLKIQTGQCGAMPRS